MNRFVFSAVGIALFTMACGSNGSSGSGGTGATNEPATALAYTSPCAPTSCSDSPVGDDKGVATCSTGTSGSCGWAPGAPGSTPPSTGGGTSGGSPGNPGTSAGGEPGSSGGSSGSGDPGGSAGTGGGVTSFAPCDASACTAIPAIACAPGYQLETPQCGSLNGGACTYIVECEPEVTGTCSDDQCGPQEDIARICNDGSTGTMVCTKTTNGCSWLDECPGDPGDPIGL